MLLRVALLTPREHGGSVVGVMHQDENTGSLHRVKSGQTKPLFVGWLCRLTKRRVALPYALKTLIVPRGILPFWGRTQLEKAKLTPDSSSGLELVSSGFPGPVAPDGAV